MTGSIPSNLRLYASKDAPQEEIKRLEEALGLVCSYEEPGEDMLILYRDSRGLSLRQGKLAMQGDFTEKISRLKAGAVGSEMLVKAARLKGFEGEPYLLDATAGMGEDSLLLAAAGFRVHLYEYDPVIALLLEDTLRRAADHPFLAPIAARMTLHHEDSIEALRQMAEDPAATRPDVILLDPMFPARSKSALIKKKFQLLQQLERPCGNEAELLDAACALRPRKLVIKRPIKGPFLADRKPDYSIEGKAIRYDCLIFTPQ